MSELQEFLTATAAELGVPGATAGVLLDGVETTAFHGVTSIENPLPVDAATLFQFGSTGKTYTATAVMRLVDQGRLALDDKVRAHVPELTLRDEDCARELTVLQLLNHTAGYEGDSLKDTGDGDDCLDRFMESMADLQQVTPLGATVSYNNASLSLAGLVIARVTGTTYEQAISDLLLEPLGMDMTFFRPTDVMTRRFCCGHEVKDGGTTVARPWALPRSGAPAGGMSATVGDQLAWARFHLGDGTAADGTRLLSAELLASMQEPTVQMPGSALGDAVGISWLLRDLDGTRLVGHGGTTHGQHSSFTMVPSRGFAVTCLSNSGPNGPQLNDAVVKWALEHHLGLKDADLVAGERSDAELEEFTGTFETIAVTVDFTAVRGGLDAVITYKPETLRQLRDAGDDSPAAQPPIHLGLVPGTDQYVVTEGPAKGMRGYFTRDASGRVDGVHVGGRLANRVSVPA